MRKKKSKKNEFRCMICNELSNEKSDFWVPLLVDNEINEMKVCMFCYADNLLAVAAFNADFYLLRGKRKTKNKPKKKVSN